MENNGNIAQRQSNVTLGRYQLLQRIGRGGMGEVWLSYDPRLRRQVAIKTLPPQNQNDREFAARFEREAQAAATLNHPHILPVHDYGEEHLPGGHVINYIVMPYIGNGSLADYLDKLADKHTGISENDAIHYLMQMAEAIDYAHEQGIIHRDIKPANMLMRSSDWLMLTDFGIARIVDDPRKQTQTNMGAGTPEYMAPEQAQGQAVAASDTYSLAVIAYQFFTGRLPFRADTSYATIIQHITMPPPPPRNYNPHLSPGRENALLRGLAKNPVERFPSARAFVAELQSRRDQTSSESTFIKPMQAPASSRAISDFPATATTMGDLASAGPRTTDNFSPTQSQEDLPTIRNAAASKASQATINRRALITGGIAATIIVAGAGAWEVATHQFFNSAARSQPTSSTSASTSPTAQATPDPNGPTYTLLGHDQPVASLAWSPQKNVLVSSASDNTVKLWNLQQYQQQATITRNVVTRSITSGENTIVAWSQDGKYVAIANTGQSADFSKEYISVYMSDLSGLAPAFSQPIQVPSTALSLIQGLGWLDSRYIVASSGVTNGTQENIQISMWDITRPELQFTPALISNQVLGVPTPQPLAISPDNQYVALPLANNLIVGKISLKGNNVQWQQTGKTLQFDSTGIPYTTDAAAWLSDSYGLIAFNNSQPSKLVAWNIRQPDTSAMPFTLPGSQTVLTALTCSPVAGISAIAAASKDGTIYLWESFANSASPNPTRALHNGNVQGTVTSLAWSADGQWLAASYNDTNDTILVWKL